MPRPCTRTVAGPHHAHATPLLAPAEVVVSPETRIRYRVDRLIGRGGFGEVYLVRRLGASAKVPEVLCLKVSPRMDGWLREAYFGQLLDGHERAIRVFEPFPDVRADGRVFYCLALEYAPQGDLSAFLERTARPWKEREARREIAGLLEVLRKLHRGQVLHRDLTPMNVFVGENRRLKLGDFGIVRQQTHARGVTADALNPSMAPSDLVDAVAPKWQTRDDVYQVGQLLAMLIRGDARARVRTADVRHLGCSDHLKEIIYRCVGERRKRYESADELIGALTTPPARLDTGRLPTLKGVHLAFTGILSRPRRDAIRAARRAGAVVHGMPSARTSVVVRGTPNAQQAADATAV